MNITKAKPTEAEQRFMGLPPWHVAGNCFQCSKPVQVRFYGLLAELFEIKLVCKDCQK